MESILKWTKLFLARTVRPLAMLLILTCTSIGATAAEIVAVPTAWRLQNYVGSNVALWFTGSPCANGLLVLPANATTAEVNRLWSTVMGAKISGKRVQIFYTVNADSCVIGSFGLIEE